MYVLKSQQWLSLECIDEMGIVKLVDGSLFPTIKSMYWASYKSTKNAIRLHLEFDLNKMIPTTFIAQNGNSSERDFLISILTKGVTYIADRGYFSFELGNLICKKEKAFLIMRIRENLKITVLKTLEITANNSEMPSCFFQLTDQIIRFNNDKFQHKYRLICFKVLESNFMICTNRFDLMTLQIITLYAYRWQIELLFKFLKRTLNGIHLFNNSENGVNIHFYIFMITLLLQLRFKQICQQKRADIMKKGAEVLNKKSINNNIKNNQYYPPEDWIKDIATPFYVSWKIPKMWLVHLKNLIIQPFDEDVIDKLAPA